MGQRRKKAEEQNLIDAAHHLLNTNSGADDVQEDLLFLNASKEILDLYNKKASDDIFLVLHENWDAVNLFNNCSTQWRYLNSGEMIGLNYNGVSMVMKMMKLKHKKKVFMKLQIMEQIALSSSS